MITPVYMRPVTYSRWCILRKATQDSYVMACGARIDASEILFAAIHPPGQVCTACRVPTDEFTAAGQITVVSKVSVDMLGEQDFYAAYEIIPGEHREPSVVVDGDIETEDPVSEWGGP